MKGGGFRTGKAVGLYGELSDITAGPDDLDSAGLPLPPRLLLGLPDQFGDLRTYSRNDHPPHASGAKRLGRGRRVRLLHPRQLGHLADRASGWVRQTDPGYL